MTDSPNTTALPSRTPPLSNVVAFPSGEPVRRRLSALQLGLDLVLVAVEAETLHLARLSVDLATAIDGLRKGLRSTGGRP